MDGTILDSIAVANRIWTGWAERHGLDAGAILAVVHGVRDHDTVLRFAAAGVDPRRESEAITEAEVRAVDGLVEIHGADHFPARPPAELRARRPRRDRAPGGDRQGCRR